MQVKELIKVINAHCYYEIIDRDGTVYKTRSTDFSDWTKDINTRLPDYILNSYIYHIKIDNDTLIIVLKGLGDK